MNQINTGGPAFPSPHFPDELGYLPAKGMTLRDYLAIHASDEDVAAHMQGPLEPKQQTDMMGRSMVVSAPSRRTREHARYAFADAMLRAREAT